MVQFKSNFGNVFTVRLITEEDHPEILERVTKDFLIDEPISKVSPPGPERIGYFIQRIKIFLSQNLSLLAIDQATGQIAGISINKINDVNNNLVPPPKVLTPLRECFIRLSKEVDFYKMFNVSIYGEIFVLSTRPEFRGQKLGSFLFVESIKLLKEIHNVKVLQVVASSPFTRRIAAQQGFKEVYKLKFSEFKGDDGTLAIPHITDETDGELVISSFVYND